LSNQSEILYFVQKTWEQALERLRQFGVKIDRNCPIHSFTVEEECDPFNARIVDGSLYINKECIKNQYLLSGAVARECFKSVFPSNRICEECVDDIATEFARQTLEEGKRDEWVELWRRHTPSRHVIGVLHHDPSKSYPALYKLVSTRGLQSIVNDLLATSKYQIHLSLEDYLEYFETRYQRFSAELSRTELRIVNYLLRDPTTTTDDIAQYLALSPQWVSTEVTELQKRYILRKFEVVRFSKIGIRMFHLLIGTDNPNESSLNLLDKCPFVYGMRRVLSGPWQLLATLTIPDNQESIRAVDEFMKTVNRWDFQTVLTEVVSSGIHYCFDYYSVDTAGWDIPWDLERIQVRKIYTDSLSSAFPRIDHPREGMRLEFDDLDMKILDRVWNRVGSVAKIRKELHVGQERVATKLRLLREEGIVNEQWEIHNIGLTESIALFTSDVEIGKAIAAWANRLPKSIVSFDLDNQLMMISSVPVGGGYGMGWALESLSKAVSANLLGPPIYGRWGFPLHLWRSDSQRWTFPDQQVAEWFESFR